MQDCDCGLLLFHRELFPAMLRQLAAATVEASRLPHLLAAFTDAGRLLAHARLPHATQLQAKPQNFVLSSDCHRCSVRMGRPVCVLRMFARGKEPLIYSRQ